MGGFAAYHLVKTWVSVRCITWHCPTAVVVQTSPSDLTKKTIT
jgi:hypothetical protein